MLRSKVPIEPVPPESHQMNKNESVTHRKPLAAQIGTQNALPNSLSQIVPFRRREQLYLRIE